MTASRTEKTAGPHVDPPGRAKVQFRPKFPGQEQADPFVAMALPLLQEYTAKLDSLVDQVQALAGRSADDLSERQKQVQQQQGEILNLRIHRLEKATADLARRVSQYVEHGDVDDNSRFELRLRLADLEAAREAALQSQLLATMR